MNSDRPETPPVHEERRATLDARCPQPISSEHSDSADAFMWALMQTGDLKTLVAMLPRPKNQRGFSVTEFLVLLWLLLVAGGLCVLVWVVIHFVSKIW